jgi:hypothetical protein
MDFQSNIDLPELLGKTANGSGTVWCRGGFTPPFGPSADGLNPADLNNLT